MAMPGSDFDVTVNLFQIASTCGHLEKIMNCINLRSAQSAAASEQSAGGWSTVKVATWPSEEAESLADFNFGNDIRNKARIPVYVYRSDSSILSARGMRERKAAINRTTGVRRLEQFGKEGERFHLDKTYRCLRWSSMIRSCTFSW